MSMHRRLVRLEATIRPHITPEIRALAERMAAADGDLYTADELLAEVEATMQAIGSCVPSSSPALSRRRMVSAETPRRSAASLMETRSVTSELALRLQAASPHPPCFGSC
jgi:hypothetical protein